MCVRARVVLCWCRQFDDLDVRAGYMDKAISGATSTAVPEDAVDDLIAQVRPAGPDCIASGVVWCGVVWSWAARDNFDSQQPPPPLLRAHLPPPLSFCATFACVCAVQVAAKNALEFKDGLATAGTGKIGAPGGVGAAAAAPAAKVAEPIGSFPAPPTGAWSLRMSLHACDGGDPRSL